MMAAVQAGRAAVPPARAPPAACCQAVLAAAVSIQFCGGLQARAAAVGMAPSSAWFSGS